MGNLEGIVKQFTRFFVPGIAFFVFAVAIPALRLGLSVLPAADSPFGLGAAVLISILIGYVLDAIKGYRWTVMLQKYNQKKSALAASLASIAGPGESSNPDHYIAVLWMRDEATYNRIFIERAEWVMILETSFSLLVGSVILGVLEIHAFFMSKSVEPAVVVLSLVLLVASCLSAINGIDRMTAHDLKLVEAMRTVLSAEHEKRREQGASALPVSTV